MDSARCKTALELGPRSGTNSLETGSIFPTWEKNHKYILDNQLKQKSLKPHL